MVRPAGPDGSRRLASVWFIATFLVLVAGEFVLWLVVWNTTAAKYLECGPCGWRRALLSTVLGKQPQDRLRSGRQVDHSWDHNGALAAARGNSVPGLSRHRGYPS